jgi:hypothetical protein
LRVQRSYLWHDRPHVIDILGSGAFSSWRIICGGFPGEIGW